MPDYRRNRVPVWEHTIRDERDYAAHVDYIHFHPVKHGLAAKARDWEYSSFRRCVAAELYPAEWDGAGVLRLMARSLGESSGEAARCGGHVRPARVGALEHALRLLVRRRSRM
jgi:hypothetical protein